MSRETTVIRLRQPDAIDDPLSELAREGARRMLGQVLIAEADAFVAMWKDVKLPDGRDRVVRHGHGPERAIQTGIGPVAVRRAKVRDRGKVGAAEKIRFTSSILPKWARRTQSLDALLPILYLRGISTGDFQEALSALLGKDAPNLSPAVITRLTAEWQADYDAWQKRDLSARRYVYVWADGVYLQARMEAAAECMLVLIGATPEGKKELVGFQTGVRERAELAGAPRRRQAAWARNRAGPGRPRRRAWLLEGDRGGLSRHPAPALLGSQDRQRAEQGRSFGPGQHEGGPPRDLRRADTRGGRGRGRRVRRQIRRQVRQGGRLPDEGSRGATRLLRFSRRALGSPAHIEPDRERVRHGASSDRADKRISVAQDRQAHGVQARLGGRENMAAPEGRNPVAQGRPGRQISNRRRGHRNAGSQRRLIDVVTQNPA